MSNITALKSEASEFTDMVVERPESAIEIARENGFTSVSIVMTNGETNFSDSAHLNRFGLLGALAQAQHDVAAG